MPKGLKEEANQQKLSNFVAPSSVSPAPPAPSTKGNQNTKKQPNQDISTTSINNKKENTRESKKRKKNSGDKPPKKKLIADKETRNMDLDTRFNELEARLSTKSLRMLLKMLTATSKT